MKKPNRLISEKSPYLLQHAYNPVDWYPWGEEAFRKAKAEDKPIFLSIGYSTCHWCHVMERESFENPDIAAIMNDRFVNIKVDREELPHVDSIYMTALQMMGARGGWPLNMFLTPDLQPFFGGTYFPPFQMHGLASFSTVLERVSEAWNTKRNEILFGARQLSDAIAASSQNDAIILDPLSGKLQDDAFAELQAGFDSQNAGFGSAPKFPQAPALTFCLNYFACSGEPKALNMAVSTLKAMHSGGIYDHIGGGFHRYSVDSLWMVPHFEKMLYDNALLSSLYFLAWRITKDVGLLQTGCETLDYIIRDMTAPEGGFYTAEDADSEGEEGRFYLWTIQEIEDLLGDHAPPFCARYGITKQGNFEHGRNIPHHAASLEEIARMFGIPLTELETQLAEDRMKLLKTRSQRVRPGLDDKILTGWNGLMISAMALGFQCTENIRYLNAAKSAAGFILDQQLQDGMLLRRYRSGDSGIPGSLEDYSFFIQGLIDLYEADFDPEWISKADLLAQKMIDLFFDRERGGFYDSPEETPHLLVRMKEGYDSAMPSPNSAAAQALGKLSRLCRKDEYRKKAETIFAAFGDQMMRFPSGFLGLINAAFPYYYCAPADVVITGDLKSLNAQQMLKAVRLNHFPNLAVALAGSTAPPMAAGYDSSGPPAAYVCCQNACRPPTTNASELLESLAPSRMRTI